VLTDSRRLDVEYLNGGHASYAFDEPLAADSFRTNLAYGRGHLAQLADFVEAIHEHRAPLCDGHAGRRVLAVIKAIYADARVTQP
jgi:UDP-N-acetyl-2-amino-2-deoxyglucuronate dehydrogenase